MKKKGIFGFGIVFVIALICILTIGLVYIILFGVAGVLKGKVDVKITENLVDVDYNKIAVNYLSSGIKDKDINKIVYDANIADLINLYYNKYKAMDRLRENTNYINLPVFVGVSFSDLELIASNERDIRPYDWANREVAGVRSCFYKAGVDSPIFGSDVKESVWYPFVLNLILFGEGEVFVKFCKLPLVDGIWRKEKNFYRNLKTKQVLDEIELLGVYEEKEFEKDYKKLRLKRKNE